MLQALRRSGFGLAVLETGTMPSAFGWGRFDFAPVQFFNIHTAINKAGEIRGRILKGL
jgi:hypothetical protein